MLLSSYQTEKKLVFEEQNKNIKDINLYINKIKTQNQVIFYNQKINGEKKNHKIPVNLV